LLPILDSVSTFLLKILYQSYRLRFLCENNMMLLDVSCYPIQISCFSCIGTDLSKGLSTKNIRNRRRWLSIADKGGSAVTGVQTCCCKNSKFFENYVVSARTRGVAAEGVCPDILPLRGRGTNFYNFVRSRTTFMDST